MIIVKDKQLTESSGVSAGYKIWNETFVKMLTAAGWIPEGSFADLNFLRDEFVTFLNSSSDAIEKQASFLKQKGLQFEAGSHNSFAKVLNKLAKDLAYTSYKG
jgi:hypothetical protein